MSELDPHMVYLDELEYEFRRVAQRTRVLPMLYRSVGLLSCGELTPHDYVQIGFPPVVSRNGTIVEQGRGISLRVVGMGIMTIEYDSDNNMRVGGRVEVFGCIRERGVKRYVPHVISKDMGVAFRHVGDSESGRLTLLGRECNMLTVNREEIF